MSEDQKPRTDNESKQSSGQPELQPGVKVLGGPPSGGVKRLSVREPGELETTVETSTNSPESLDADGRRVWTRVQDGD